MTIHSVDVPVPAELAEFFKRPPILAGESPTQYEAVFTSLAMELKPQGPLAWLQFKDIVESFWDIRRWKNAKAALVDLTRRTARRQVLESIAVGDEAKRSRFVDKNADARFLDDEERTKLEQYMHKYGLCENDIDAQAMALRLPDLELIDRQLARARANCMTTLREFEYYRDAGGWRQAVTKLVDVEGSMIPLAPPGEQGAGAQDAGAQGAGAQVASAT